MRIKTSDPIFLPPDSVMESHTYLFFLLFLSTLVSPMLKDIKGTKATINKGDFKILLVSEHSVLRYICSRAKDFLL